MRGVAHRPCSTGSNMTIATPHLSPIYTVHPQIGLALYGRPRVLCTPMHSFAARREGSLRSPARRVQFLELASGVLIRRDPRDGRAASRVRATAGMSGCPG